MFCFLWEVSCTKSHQESNPRRVVSGWSVQCPENTHIVSLDLLQGSTRRSYEGNLPCTTLDLLYLAPNGSYNSDEASLLLLVVS